MASGDVIVAGGGLAGGLVALALARLRPEVRVTVVEGAATLGGNHVWSFFDPDIDAADRWLVEPLIASSWPDYEVRFPTHRRRLATGYHSCTSQRLDAALRTALPADRLLTGRPIGAVTPDAVILADGGRLTGSVVIDARGPAELRHLDLGWQKFVGHEIETDVPHGVERPLVMDATVAQLDGYRFVYLLPFTATRLLVEDTYYSDTPDLDIDGIDCRIDAYADAAGWAARRLVRRETGVLPVAMGGDFDAYWYSGGEGVAKAGLRAGLFHPTTGYSLPDAVRTATAIAAAPDLSAAALHDFLYRRARRIWRRRGYYRMLDTMLFRAAVPSERYRVLQRFYRLAPPLIERFYGARSTMADKVRVVAGRPPVPVAAALRALIGGRR